MELRDSARTLMSGSRAWLDPPAKQAPVVVGCKLFRSPERTASSASRPTTTLRFSCASRGPVGFRLQGWATEILSGAGRDGDGTKEGVMMEEAGVEELIRELL